MSEPSGNSLTDDLDPRDTVGRYKIGTVATMVGVTPNLLRAWEQRYDILQPTRQPSKQRLYSDQDVALLRRVVQGIQQGLRISEVVSLGREGLLKKGAGSTLPVPRPSSPTLLGVPDAKRDSIGPSWRDPEARPRHRYTGESLDVSVRDLAPVDLATLHRVYQILKGLYELWTYTDQQTVAEIVVRRLRLLYDPQLRSQVFQLGLATAAPEGVLHAALHDARYGALSLLLDSLEKLDLDDCDAQSLNLFVSLARDQAKILRNAFNDLDPALREADEHRKAHSVMPILSKIDHLRQAGWVAEVGTDFDGFITCRCLETSALDRLLYRLLARFERGEKAPSLWVTQGADGWVRWAFDAPESEQNLAEPEPFAAKVMALVTGLTAEQALAQGVLGAKREEGRDWVWFHWPSYSPGPDVALCSCHPLP